MTFRNRPNSGVAVLDGDTTTLLYAPRVNPSPLTASLPGQNPVLGSLEVVITNAGTADVKVDSITFTLQVGTGATLTPGTAGILAQTSNTQIWMVTGPSGPVTSGPAEYRLGPVADAWATLAAGTSVVVQIYGFATNLLAGTTTIAIKEMLYQTPPSFGSFQVTTFPPGFFFNSLAVTVPSGSNLVPVAQVQSGTPVCLTWNTSVVEVDGLRVLYSTQQEGQQTVMPSRPGEWQSPPVTADTVFTLVVTTTTEGGEPLTASMSVAVAVQNPTLVAHSLTAGTVTATAAVARAATVTELTAASATVQQGLQVNGTLAGAAATFQKVVIDTVCQVPYVNAQNGSFSRGLSVGGPVSLLAMAQQLNPGAKTTYTANSDGLVVGYVPLATTNPPGYIGGTCGPLALYAAGNYSQYTGNSFTLPVSKGSTFTLGAVGGGLFYIVPLGSGGAVASPLAELVGESEPGAEPLFNPVARGSEARSELVGALTEAFGPVSDAAHQRLIHALEQMG